MSIDTIEHLFKTTRNLDGLNQRLTKHLAQLSIHAFSFTYYTYHPRSKNKLKYSFAPPSFRAWHEHYLEEEYNCVDSTIDSVYQNVLPIYWSVEGQQNSAKTSRERKMREDAIALGTKDGLSIPIHGPDNDFAILMIQQSKEQNLSWPAMQENLFYIAHLYYQQVRQFLLKSMKESGALSLSQREMQCLTLLAQNFSVEAIARTLNITQRTVNYHIQNINKKFGVKSKYQAVAEAKRRKCI